MVINRALLDLFAERRVFHQLTRGERWRVGEPLGHGTASELEPYCHFHQGHLLPRRMGAFSYINSRLSLSKSEIGRYCSIGGGVLWMAPSHPVDWATTSPFSYEPRDLQGFAAYLRDSRAPLPFVTHPYEKFTAHGVRIGNDVWIGDEAAIRDGVTIGDGAVIAARATVAKDVAPYTVVAGSPARVVRDRFPPALVERFLKLRWWRFGPEVVQPLDVRAPEAFLDRLEAAIEQGAKPFEPAPLTLPEMLAAAGASA